MRHACPKLVPFSRWRGVERGWVGANCSYWRTEELLQALTFAPDVVTVMLGTNDAKFRNWGPLSAEFPVDYQAMIASFKNMSSKPKIWLMVPPPLYQNNRYGMNQVSL